MLQTVDETLSGLNVFITGGSGFLGRVLIEHLLRCCPNVGKIFVLTREKRGKSIEDRWNEISELPLYEKLHTMYPNAFKRKVVPIAGNMWELGLGVCANDLEQLRNDVHVVYHIAATVKFNQPLKEAILMNIRGTREVCLLALHMTQLKCFVHVSTCYCNINYQTIEERLYPALADWRKCIDIAENCNRHELQILMKLFLEDFPNTYTYTKQLAEHVVYDLLNGRIASLVIRPSIVGGSLSDPMPGWIDNYNGPTTLFFLGGIGVSRLVYGNGSNVDGIPVDSCIKSFIVAAWWKLSQKDLQTDFYNVSTNGLINADNVPDILLDIGRNHITFKDQLFYPVNSITMCYYYYYIYVMILQVFPSLLADGVLKLLNKKPKLYQIQRQLFGVIGALNYFYSRQWTFLNDKTFALNDKLLAGDQKTFNFELNDFNMWQYLYNCSSGFKTYLLKDRTELNRTRNKCFEVFYYLIISVSVFLSLRYIINLLF